MPQQGEGHRQAEREMVLQALRAGNTRRASAGYAGIEWSTLWRWTQEDATFRSQVEKAEADAEVRHVANIAKAATDGVWTASAWWLERRQHGDWGRKDMLALKLGKMSEEELDDYIAAGERALAEAREGDPALSPADEREATEPPALPE